MAARLPIWGIDVGQCSLKAIKLHQTGDQLEMQVADVVEHESILSQAQTDAPEMIHKSIETFLSRNDLKDSRVVVSVPGQQTLTRFTKMPPVESKKIPDMVQYEASQQIPFDMDEVVWDYQVFTEEDSPDVEVGIFAIRKELIRNHLTHFTSAGIEPIIVQTSPMASYNAAQYERPAKEGKATILLDMGALATDLIIFEGNRIWSRPVPIGGNRFTEALVSAFKISFRKAEKLKRSAATSKYARQVFQAMRPVFADLVSEVQRSIGFYTSTHRDAAITLVLGMGNAFKLPGLQKFLQQNLQIEVQRFSSFKKIVTTSAENRSDFADNIMSFTVAYGLALQGLGLASVRSSLLPVEVHRALLWRKKHAWFAASAASLALAAGSLWVGNVMANGQLDKDVGNLSNIALVQVNSVDQAEQIIRSGAGSARVERAAKVGGAARKLQQEFNQVAGARIGDRGTLERAAKLPQNNKVVPQIVDAIDRAFGEIAVQEIQAVKTAQEYQRLAEQLPRGQRGELWIRRFDMAYHTKDPSAKYFRTPGDKNATKPGWAIEIFGRTTEPDQAKLTKLIEAELIPALDRLGKRPGRGFHFVEVTLDEVTDAGGKLPNAIWEGIKRRLRPGRTRVGVRGRGETPQNMTRRPRRPGGGMVLPQRKGRTKNERRKRHVTLRDWAKKFKTQDPLTGEDKTEDQRFVIRIVVRQGDTPEKLIPEEYREQKDENDQASGTGG